jgi:MerR family transcriptional regulator, Zn(II)-responsive regulator of zntA
MANYLRGQIAKNANVNIETLRYYEKNGLIPEPLRTESGYRLYPEETLARIEFIKMAKYCGFTLNQIKQLFLKVDSKIVDLAFFTDVIDKKIQKVDCEILELEKLKSVLVSLKDNMEEPQKSSKVRAVMNILKIE